MDNQNPISELENTKKGATIMMWVRTIIYIVGLLASLVSFGIDLYGYHQLAQLIAMCGSFLAGALGVVYNPINNLGGNQNGRK